MSNLKQWVKDRWIELRIGTSSYLAYIIAFTNLVILISLKLPNTSIMEYLLLIIILASAGIIIGALHLRWQQTTDVKRQFEWLVEETANRVLKKMEENEK